MPRASRVTDSFSHERAAVLRSALFAVLVAAIAAPPPPTATTMTSVAPDTLGQFPHVEGTNLEGDDFALPADFKGAVNVVFVAFKREQQADVDSWTPFMKPVLESRRQLRAYELPVLGRRYRLVRSFIDGGMRRGIPDATVRAATITLYIDKSPFRDALRLHDEERIYVLLVDQQGRVLWRTEGHFDERAGAELVRRIDELSAAH